ncbi:phospholipase D-like domain-containing protein [Microcoleus sp. w2-18aC4]|uniref:phospholipase D-like domain-containing protein n=1 Tax=Microcoleus sp. w2-18aC4 TaxID=2818996 RepID=UPI002FD78009
MTGSHNWSEAANRANDETLLVVESATVGAHFEQEFVACGARSAIGSIKAQFSVCHSASSRRWILANLNVSR